MPVINEPNKVIKNSNGSLVDFTFNFKFFEDEDLVIKTITPEGIETLRELDTDYTVSSDDKNAGGTITFVTAPATGTLLIKRQLPLEQGANFRPVSGFPEQVITDALDRGMLVDQDLQEQINRGLILPEGSSIVKLAMPTPEAGKVLKWGADEISLENSIVPIDDIQTYIDAAEASAAAAATSETNAGNSATSASGFADNASDFADAADLSADRAEAAASGLETIVPEVGSSGKFPRVMTPYTNGYEFVSMDSEFSINSGNVTAGESDLLVGTTSTTLTFKVDSGTTYKPLKITYADKTQESLTSLASITGLSSNGNYAVIKEKGSNPVSILSTKVTQGKIFPVSPADGDYHCLTATGLQTYKRVSGAWVETQYVPIGTATVASNVISAVTSNRYNVNGYDGVGHNIVETYSNGTSWYRKYSDGWIEQGGIQLKNATTIIITFPVVFKDTNYSFISSPFYNVAVPAAVAVDIPHIKTASNMTISSTSAAATYYVNWEAKGY